MAYKFKVGDKVRCIEAGLKHEYTYPHGYGWQLDLVFVVRTISEGGRPDEVIYWGDGSRGDAGVYEDALELWTDKIAIAFDKLRQEVTDGK